MEVKPGYKQTEVGVIPEEWEVIPINRIFQFKQGVQTPVEYQSPIEKEGFKRFIRIIDLTEPRELWRYIPDPGSIHHVGPTDLFMVRYGSPGLLGFGHEGVIANNLFRLIPKREIHPTFFSHYFARREVEIASLSGSSTMPAVNFSALGGLQVVCPPLPEQHAIADALSDVDGLLGGLNRLIAKKRDLKQAVMHQLLTGQTRLSGFQGEWKLMKLGELCDYVDGLPTIGGDLGYLEIGDVNVESKSYDVSQKEKPSVRGAVRVPAGTLLISTVRPTRGAIVITKSSLHVSSAFCRLRPANGLLFHLACHAKFLAYLGENSIGGTYPTCRDETILGYESVLPPDPAEQTAIAEVLTEMDLELAALEQRREKTRALKQAMMQELLTGKTRLV
jgi:type I restriction enzyme, S subunit